MGFFHSIWDDLGGVANTVGNAAVAGIKDVGDLGSLAAANITGNQQAAQNASNAISSNDSNLSGENFGQNATGLGGDIWSGVIQPIVQPAVGLGIGAGTDLSNLITGNNETSSQLTQGSPLQGLNNWASNNGQTDLGGLRSLSGNALQTGVNLLTLGKGKALEQGGEQLLRSALGDGADNFLGRAATRTGTSALVGAGAGAASGAGQAVGSAQNWKQAATDVGKGAESGGVAGGVIGGVTAAPGVIKGTVDAARPTAPFTEAGGAVAGDLPGGSHLPDSTPEPTTTENDVAQIHQDNPLAPDNVFNDVLKPATEDRPGEIQSATPVVPATGPELAPETTPIDYSQVDGATQKLQDTTNQVAQSLREQDLNQAKAVGPTDLYQQIKSHGGIGASDFEDVPSTLKRKNGMSMDRVAQEMGYPDSDTLHEAILKEGESRANPVKVPPISEYKDMAKTYIQNKAANPIDAEGKGYADLIKHSQVEQEIKANEAANRDTGYNKIKHKVPTGAPKRAFNAALDEKINSPEHALAKQRSAEFQDVQNTHKIIKAQHEAAQKVFNKMADKPGSFTKEQREAQRREVRSLATKHKVLGSILQNSGKAWQAAKLARDEKYPYELTNGKTPRVRVTGDQAYVNTRPTNTVRVVDSAKPASTGAALLTPEDWRGFTPPEVEPYTGPNLNENAFDPKEMEKLQQEEADRQAAADNGPGLLEKQNADGDRAILDAIKNGKSDDEIIKAYRDASGASEAEAQQAYGKLEDDPNVDKAGDVNNNPYHGKIADYSIETKKPGKISVFRDRTKAVLQKSLLKAVAPGDHLLYKHLDATHLWNQLTPEDKALADSLRNHSPEEVAQRAKDPEAFLKYAKRSQDIEDYIHAGREVHDPFDQTPYLKNHGAGFYTKGEGNMEHAPMENYLGKDQGYAKARHFSNYADMEKSTGRTRSTQDYHEDLTNDVLRAQNHISNHSLFHSLGEGFGYDKVSFGKKAGAATTQLKQFKDVFTTPELAKRINERAPYEYGTGAVGKGLKGYDVVNQSMKNLKLSVGGFHNINEMLNQAALNPSGTGKASAALVNPEYYRSQMNEWDRNGTMEKALHTGLTLGTDSENVFKRTGKDLGKSIQQGIVKMPGFKQAHEALFGRQIPFSKMQVFERYTKNLNLNNPSDYATMRGVSRGLNNTFGGLNRLVDGMNPTYLKWASRTILAVDYNEGQIRTLLSAISKGGVEGRMARQVVAGRAAILAMPGTAQAAINHTLPNPEQDPKKFSKFIGSQLVDPSVTTPWKTAGGVPKRISLVAGIVNKGARIIGPALDSSNPDKFSGLQREATGNLGPLPSLVEAEKNNKDFFGNPMRTGNVLQDVANAVNFSAPIPASPVARVVAGSRFGNNPVVNTLDGGQKPITAAEAAVDVSGVGRVSADPRSPVMQIMNNRQKVYNSQDKDTQAAIDQIHPSWGGMSKAQQNAVYSNPYYEINKWETFLHNPAAFNAMKSQDAFAAKHGEPSNPLFQLNPADQKTLATYELLKHADPGSDANNTAAVMYLQNKDMITKYEQDSQTYSNAMNALYQKTGGIKGDTAPPTIGGVAQYTVTPDTQTKINTYMNMDPGQARTQFLQNNPDIAQAFNAQFLAQNKLRGQLDEPLLKAYPQAPAGLSSWINGYMAADKATRTAMRNASPDNYSGMSNYLTQVDAYMLAKTAGQAQFVGQNLTQDNLKDVYNLGKYDIAKTPNADGTTSYSLDPAAAYAQSSYGGYTGGTSAGKTIIGGGAQTTGTYTKAGNFNKYGYNSLISPTALDKGLHQELRRPRSIPMTHVPGPILKKVRVNGGAGGSLRIRSSKVKIKK